MAILSNHNSPVKTGFPILTGLVGSMLCTVVMTLIISLLLLFTDFKEASLPVYVYFIHALSLFVGGFICGKRVEKKGWYHGGLMGILYSVIVITIGFLAFNTSLGVQSVMLVSLSFVMGAFGGILGVNATKTNGS